MNDFLKEKELLLNSIENNTSEHWENYYKDVPIECIYDDLVIDINEIKRLQQENKELKDNWNKLKEWLKEEITNKKEHFKFICEYHNQGETEVRIQLEKTDLLIQKFESVLDKMQEIEGGMNE